MDDSFRLGVVYRVVYGHVRDQLDRDHVTTDVERLRREPTEGLAGFDREALADPEVGEAVSEAVEDAIAGRRPRW